MIIYFNIFNSKQKDSIVSIVTKDSNWVTDAMIFSSNATCVR